MDYEVTPVFKRDNKPNKTVNDFIPVVSIVTPYYNSKAFIDETMSCVLQQSFPWFEWIIVDDGSTDEESIKKVNELKNKDKRIKVFHKKNEGLAATRDYGAKKASKSTKYLLFLDDDDLIESNYLECLYFALETNPNACFAYTNTVGFGTMNYLWDKKMDIATEVKENLLVATALIRKKDFFEVGGYGTKEKGINEDWIFWLKLFSKSKIPLKVNYYGFWYRRKPTGELKKSLDNVEKTKSLMSKYIENVDYNIVPIEYPKDNYSWDDTHRVKNPFKVISKVNSDKENIIMIMPQIVMGGADKFNVDFLKGLDKKYSVTAIITNVSDNNWLSELSKYVDDYYILPTFLDRKYWHLFIDYLIKKNNTKMVFNTNSIYGYMLLPYIKSKHEDIRIIDYVHMEEWYNRNGGYSRDSSAVASCIDMTMVCNQSSENILVDYFGRNKDEVNTVYIGVDEKKFENTYTKEEIDEIKNKYNVPKGMKIITFISRIADQKRPFLLLEIMKKYLSKYHDSIFLICGDGPLLDKLKEQVKKNDLENVMFLGAIKNTKEIYAISDCTLNCSIKEGLALTTYESLSMGVPVISSNVGGQGEIIDNKVGRLIDIIQKESEILTYEYDPKEINKFTTAVREVIEKSDSYKKDCRKRVLSNFTISTMNKRMNNYINDILSKPSNKKYENEDVALELLDQYLLNSNEEYLYTVIMYNQKHYSGAPSSNEPVKYKTNKLRAKFIKFKIKMSYKIDIISKKLNAYEEVLIIKHIFYALLRIVYWVIKLPIVIIIRIIKAIFHIFKK